MVDLINDDIVKQRSFEVQATRPHIVHRTVTTRHISARRGGSIECAGGCWRSSRGADFQKSPYGRFSSIAATAQVPCGSSNEVNFNSSVRSRMRPTDRAGSPFSAGLTVAFSHRPS